MKDDSRQIKTWNEGQKTHLEVPRNPGPIGLFYFLVFVVLVVMGFYFVFAREHLGGLIFVTIGVVGFLIYAELLFKTTLSLSSSEYVLHRRLWGKGRTWRFPVSEVSHIESHNNRGTWISFIVMTSGKRYRISSLLKKQQADQIAEILAPPKFSLLESDE